MASNSGENGQSGRKRAYDVNRHGHTSKRQKTEIAGRIIYQTLSPQFSDPPSNASSSKKSKNPNTTKTPQPAQTASNREGFVPVLPKIPAPLLYNAVFTHPSMVQNNTTPEALNSTYDRLEVLGDVYLELMATRLVYTLFPHLPAGRISQQRELLIKNETLAEYAIHYGLDKQLSIAGGLPRDKHDKRRVKILGDVFEAYVAAVVLSTPPSGGKVEDMARVGPGDVPTRENFDVAEKWLWGLWTVKLNMQSTDETRAGAKMKAKDELSRLVVSPGVIIDYVEVEGLREVEKAKTWYTVQCLLTGWGYEKVKLGQGRDLTLKEAGQRAAEMAVKEDGEVLQDARTKKKEFDQKRREEREERDKQDGGIAAQLTPSG